MDRVSATDVFDRVQTLSQRVKELSDTTGVQIKMTGITGSVSGMKTGERVGGSS